MQKMADDTTNVSTPDSDVKLLKIEAKSAVNEVKFAVKYVEISERLSNTDEQAYLNVKTKEGDEFCVELTVQGFRIVGTSFDQIDGNIESPFYETIYALLDKHSPQYRLTFGETLVDKLQLLQTELEDQEEKVETIKDVNRTH
ncbi:GSK3-beta interaction protein-like [Acanthaster planci]|uniref:GSK3-beta interaction protein-like n=1 Tax=Acanthaster planci TaxID=133434 RepID=A0A8B8A0H3_ACAPL|nr:GSK3-beta interaction protein-like [Acanthaster planci]